MKGLGVILGMVVLAGCYELEEDSGMEEDFAGGIEEEEEHLLEEWFGMDEYVEVYADLDRYTKTIRDVMGETEAVEGEHYVVLDVKVESVGEDVHHVTPNNVTLFDSEGNQYRHSEATDYLERGKKFLPVDIGTGEVVKGKLVFEISKDVDMEKLVYEPAFGERIEVLLRD